MNKKNLFLMLICGMLFSCNGKQSDTEEFNATTELGQQVGDVMSAVDESAGSTGSFAMISEINAAQKSLARFDSSINNNNFKFDLFSKLIPTANAASCFGTGFMACSSGVIQRNFNSCTVGSAVFTGGVTLTYSNPACGLPTISNTVKRNPNFQITTNVGTVSVTKMGTDGQQLQYLSGTGADKVFSLTSDGIKRSVTVKSDIKSDITTLTTSTVTVTGSGRTRMMTGGQFRLQNNLTSEQCDVSPSAVQWSAGCTCATSGTWTGTCQLKGGFSMNITGCGTATLTVGGADPKEIILNRCSGS